MAEVEEGQEEAAQNLVEPIPGAPPAIIVEEASQQLKQKLTYG